MHEKAIEIISETMNRLIDVKDIENYDALRELNSDSFLQRLNQELMNADPTLAINLGIKTEGGRKVNNSQKTPEELAQEEAEREKML